MNIIYIHGLDSDANATKGRLLEDYCRKNHPDIIVMRPDLNKAPGQVFEQLVKLATTLDKEDKTVLIGSSLGGYFATLVSNHTGLPALLLNPSIQPHITLQRFALESAIKNESLPNQIIHSTTGGWDMTRADLQWFADHPLSAVIYPERTAVLIKNGDELLNPLLSKNFYQRQGVKTTLQAGGDHRFSDFCEQLPMVISTLKQLANV